jgi:membrane-associated phospholipid phosphatase
MQKTLGYIARWMLLLAGYGTLWFVIHQFGVYGVPMVNGLDRAVSAAINPDAYTPLLDEFFRALTDYTNVLIALPVVSLAVAAGVYQTARLPRARALRHAALVSLAWAGLAGAICAAYRVHPGVALGVIAIAPTILLIGAAPPLLLPRLEAKRWIVICLMAETILLLACWAAGLLWWNKGLPGANYLLLIALCAALAGMVLAFHRMPDTTIARFGRLFWLVLLCIVLVELGATNRLKEAIGRPRPLNDANAPWNAVMRPIPEETLRGNNSFPSGHVSGTFGLITPLFWWLRDRRARAGLLLWGGLQGVSRIYTAAHFLSDCVMGAALGFGTGTLVFFLLGGPALRGPAPPAKAAAG